MSLAAIILHLTWKYYTTWHKVYNTVKSGIYVNEYLEACNGMHVADRFHISWMRHEVLYQVNIIACRILYLY